MRAAARTVGFMPGRFKSHEEAKRRERWLGLGLIFRFDG
jgi:hypothetical protein